MKFTGVALAAASLASLAAAKVALPLHTSGRWILDANNDRVKFRCINWAGHMEVNLPEGLHKRSISDLADWIKDQGFNCVRLTYSIDHALNPNISVANAFENAAAAAGVPLENTTAMYEAAVAKNPFMGYANTTTRDVYGAVIDALWDRGIMTVLDNHVSKAGWCCSLTDGNGWWDTASGYSAADSRYFHTREWLEGLKTMAAYVKYNYQGVVAMSLRNELRKLSLIDIHGDWYDLIFEAGNIVHGANPDVLVVVGGIDAATDLSTVRTNRMLNTTGWQGKHVWEWHSYSFTVTFPHFLPCSILKELYGGLAGFVLTQDKEYTGPLLLSEFGVGQTGGPASNEGGLSTRDSKYLSCLASYMEENDSDWAVWAIQGSYYIRNGQTDYDETWGLMNHDWTGLRNPQFPGLLGNMWNMTQGPSS